jgi:hypothetical protein
MHFLKTFLVAIFLGRVTIYSYYRGLSILLFTSQASPCLVICSDGERNAHSNKPKRLEMNIIGFCQEHSRSTSIFQLQTSAKVVELSIAFVWIFCIVENVP